MVVVLSIMSKKEFSVFYFLSEARKSAGSNFILLYMQTSVITEAESGQAAAQSKIINGQLFSKPRKRNTGGQIFLQVTLIMTK